MGINNWQRIEELFHDASQLQGAARVAFLTSQCNGDDAILQEVNSLLAASETDIEFLERPSFDLGIKILGQSGAHEGRTIGHYQIIRLLGEGGMGEVYLAEDTKLERQVALKFLVSGLFDDQGARDQLMREARAVAKLEHPHICPVYSVESIDAHDFIVMPYMEGETLDRLLRKARPSIDRVLELSEQIASALAAAHSRGIVHRDVKPQNILIAEDGPAKILDFGLAKLVARTHNPASIDDRSTASQLGLIPGTVAYMSPEQVRGDKLDGATDIFSFGIVLHEMLSGQNPFLHETREQTLKAIANEESRPLPRDVPAALTEITQKCLQKEVARRYTVADDLLVDLKKLRAVRARKLASAWRPATKLMLAAALFLIVVASVVGGSIWRQATRVHSLAILPIVNETQDLNNNYMSTGLTRSLFDRFAGIPKLRVKLPTAPPATQAVSAIQAGRVLGVESVLSGNLTKQEDKLQLHLMLTSTADGSVAWERTFEVPSVDLVALQDSVAQGVTTNVGMWMIGDEKKAVFRRPTDNEEAMRAYFRGIAYWSSRKNRDEIRTAIGFFDQAIALDPSFAEAYAGRAECHILTTNVLYGPVDNAEAISKARYDAGRAIEINPLLAEAYTAVGVIDLRYTWDWQEAEKEFKSAIAINPNYAPAHAYYATLLAVLRRFDEAINESVKGRTLDPYAPVAAVNQARALYFARRFDEAEQVLRQQLDQDPDQGQSLHSMGLVLLQQQKIPEAIAMFERRYAKDPLHTAAALGYAYGRAGRAEDAKRMLTYLEQASDPVSPPHEKALVYMGLRDWDNAFTYLQKSCDERFPSIPTMAIDPLYDDLRGDPRFQQIMNRANLVN